MPQTPLLSEITNRSVPFADISDFTPLIDVIKDKRIVMLGESTHGTKEFYEWRNLLTAELIRNHGFNFIAIEGDWPPAEQVNKFVHGKAGESSFAALTEFSRWPTWMWGNAEMVGFMDFLKGWNQTHGTQVGFHGLDVYSLFESIEQVIEGLRKLNPKLAKRIKSQYACFDPYWNNERAYTRSLLNYSDGCGKQVGQVFEELKRIQDPNSSEWINIVQNARIVKNAESYYHAMTLHNDESWNIRDRHMLETLDSLLANYGKNSKAVIWEHNTHVGDYHATDMIAQGQVNLGGLAREQFGRHNVALVGFTTFKGSVMASNMWDGPMKKMDLPSARAGSLEATLHEAIPFVGNSDYYLLFDQVQDGSPLKDYRGHRAIGVVYRSHPENRAHYVPSAVADRYDALVFIDETSALTPLRLNFDPRKVPETYPFGTRI